MTINEVTDGNSPDKNKKDKDYPLAPFPLSSLPKTKSIVPKKENENIKLMDIEQDTIPCFRLFCPTRFRPF